MKTKAKKKPTRLQLLEARANALEARIEEIATILFGMNGLDGRVVTLEERFNRVKDLIRFL